LKNNFKNEHDFAKIMMDENVNDLTY
jgi:hypothetical protein